jgi:3-phenylpropionate/trans-cinnamate dioxygenase ferredoxin reductase subunit
VTSTAPTFVIVGGGLAAAKAAETLRAEDFSGRIILIAAERLRPYQRPSLSKGILAGTEGDDALYVHGETWYTEHDVDLRTGVRALAIDPETRTVVLSDETDLRYDKLLMATGSRARKLRVPGADLAGVHYLRTKGNAEALKGEIAGGGRNVVMVGGGWIGLEVAAAARTYGNTVTVIDPNPVPLYSALGLELGGVFADLHTEHGVALAMSRHVTELVGDGTRVTGVRTDAGETVPADVVVVGIGTIAMDRLAADAGLAVASGILVDGSLRTADENIYAAGDVARWTHPLLGRSVRVEHWANALNQGPAAARSMLGQQVVYDEIPYFYTDQYDLGMEFVGDIAGTLAAGRYDTVTYRGDLDAREFIAFWTCGGRVVAGMNVNVWDVVPGIEALVRADRPVDLELLADPAVPLDEVWAPLARV